MKQKLDDLKSNDQKKPTNIYRNKILKMYLNIYILFLK